MAWAQHKGIAKVEVSVDDGPWQPATLAAEDGLDTWRQWVLPWDAAAGAHTDRSAGHRQDRLRPDRDAASPPTQTERPGSRLHRCVTVT